MNNPLQDFRPESLCLLKESQEDYWRYARKGPHDFSVYTEKSSIYEPPAKVKFRESSDVLVRWTDGLLYLATIVQVEEEYNRCAVKFEDGSQFWALFKDIYKGPLPEGEVACTICDSDSSLPSDEIVICDQCSVGYHQLCHIPKIDSSVLKLEVSWSCRKCIFASAAKKGGAMKKGPDAQLMMVIKKTLPYNPQALTWDSSHRSNLQQTYCYCGGPGEWYSKMLQCSRCKQWFHEACIQCLDEPLLLGDRFYIFVCTVCNYGPEFMRRLPIKWPDLAHLVLFNLTVIHGKKFFDLDATIMPFLKENWFQFKIKGEPNSRLHFDKRKKITEIFEKSKSRFCSAKELKKKSYIWGLKARVPPMTPIVSIPQSGVINDQVLDDFYALTNKSKPVPVKSSGASLPKKARKLSVIKDDDSLVYDSDFKIRKSGRVQTSVEREILKADLEDTKNKEKRKLPHRKARYRKPRKVTRVPPIIDLTDDDTLSSQGTLNSIIPHPTDFEGSNNPFLTNYKSDTSCDSMKSLKSTKSSTSSKSSKSLVSSNSSSKSNVTSSTSSLKNTITTPKITVNSIVTTKNNSFNADSNASKTRGGTNNVISCKSNDTGSTVSISNDNSSTKSYSTSLVNKSNVTPSATKRSFNPTNSKKTSTLRTTTLKSSIKSISSKVLNRKNTSPASTTSSNSAPSVIRSRLRLRVRTQSQSPLKSTNKSISVIDRLLNSSTPDCKTDPLKSTSSSSPSNCDLNSSVSNYFGASERIANGEKFTVLAKRITPDGTVQYLVEWDGNTTTS